MSGMELGQRVRFTGPMKRVGVYPPRKIEVQSTLGGAPHTYTRSINKEWTIDPSVRETEGVIVGKRTLSNGHVSWEEYGAEYGLAESFTAYLIAYDMRRKPVFVLPENVEAVAA